MLNKLYNNLLRMLIEKILNCEQNVCLHIILMFSSSFRISFCLILLNIYRFVI